jgi:hypothetical protein
MEKTLVPLRQWRASLRVDAIVLTRENREAVVSKIRKDKITILIGKGHTNKINRDDLFPVEWTEMVEDWRHRKTSRGPDIPLK